MRQNIALQGQKWESAIRPPARVGQALISALFPGDEHAYFASRDFVAILAAAPARATANLDCAIEDKRLKGAIGALMGSLPGLLQIHGEFDVLVQGVPDDFRKVSLAGDNLPHSWVHGKDLKLHAYKERDGERFASFELVVETKMTSDPNQYRGAYELKVSFLPGKGAESKTVTVRGRASCSLG